MSDLLIKQTKVQIDVSFFYLIIFLHKSLLEYFIN